MANPFIAQIIQFGGNFAPRAWAFCDGQILPISQNTALFSLIGCTFGGDCRTTFALPDCRGRTMVHPGNGPGLTPRQYGQKGGEESHTLSVAEMPSHSHALEAEAGNGTQQSAAGNMLANGTVDSMYLPPNAFPNSAMATQSIASAGGNQSHNNMQPWIGLYHIIALQGVFPSRS